ncbi:MAG: hypothetical protein JSW02_08630 [candidate division WOR-3 bacterium]|nr:MAG: hypothetical protein JSW02_08630 [candidate division WOR-3 bacterium]
MNFIISIFLFTQLLNPYEHRILFTSEGDLVVFARYFSGELISIDSVKSINDYLDESIKTHNRELLLQRLKQDIVQQGGYANKGLFGTFEIPLPKGTFGEFMGETGKLDVGGHVKITMGGSRTFLENLPETQGSSWLPELEMKQEMAVNLDGQVGDRMRVFIDHNSERINESQNKITVTYTGREDEIIQEIEGGDTQLSIPATNYTGDIPSHRGLFGIKSSAKLGPLDLVAIASKEQTQTEEIEIEGSIQAEIDTIWARRYQTRRFFSLGLPEPDAVIRDLRVYVDDNIPQNNNVEPTYSGTAYLDINDDNIPDFQGNPTNSDSGYFSRKTEGTNDYYIYDPARQVIELNYSIPEQQVLGVYYKKIIGIDTFEVGRLPSTADTTIQLKLLCPEYRDTTSATFDYEQKNYYQVASRGSRLDSLKIYYLTTGGDHQDRQGDTTYLELLGLDVNPRDGRVDENYVYYSSRGLLIFPDPEPFASSVLNNPIPEIYRDPTFTGTGSYYLFAKTLEAKPVYNLPTNVETVFVYVDEQLQTQGEDYHVDYDAGKLEFMRPIQPNQRVRIKAEYAPFFSAAEKSLVGVRGTLRPFGDAMLGSSFFWRNESYPAEHIRLREEPFNRMVWEVDFTLPQKLPFITRVVDWLPLVSTETESQLNFSFENAYSISNLNAKGEVFLDDLESTTIVSNDVSINRTSWFPCSKPVDRDTNDFTQTRLVWYNPRDRERLQANDIYEDPIDENEIADVLNIKFTPDDSLSYAGLTQYIYTEDFDEIENLELIINGKGGRMHVDFAQDINEDQLRRNQDGALVGYGSFQDEDMNKNYVWTQNDEDTGLDGVYGDDGSNQDALDDGNDDYVAYDSTGRVNGTEGNRIWDTEDLNRDGTLNGEDRYFSYVIDLDSDSFQIDAGLREGWKMFRVPIKDTLNQDTVVGVPDWHNIKYVRIWFDNFTQPETLLLFRLSATGSRWKNYGIVGGRQPPLQSESFSLAPVNTKTNTNYLPPYPVERDEFGQVKTEGGLELRLTDIEENHTCVAHRRTDDNEDYRAYDTLTFYLHANNSNPLVSLRIGSDSLNFYEYTTDFENGEIGYNQYRLFRVAMVQFLDLKKEKNEAGVDTMIAGEYIVVGNPSLAQNKFLEIRLTNAFVTPLSDTFWFNDVMLLSPKSDVGRILRSNGSLNVADLAHVNFAYDESNGRFKRLSESKEISTSGASRSYLVSTTVSLNKLLPDSWYFSIPVTYSYRNSQTSPRFWYNANDIEVSGADADLLRRAVIIKSYSTGFSKTNSKHWLLKNTLDRIALSYDRTQQSSSAEQDSSSTDNKVYRSSYTLDPRWNLKMLGQTFFLLPRNVSLNATYTDNLVESFFRETVVDTFREADLGTRHNRTLTPSVSIAMSPHQIVNATYTFNQVRDSVETRGRFGEEVQRNQTINASLAQSFKIVSPRFYYNATYTENHSFELRQQEDLRNVTNTGRYGVDATFNITTLLRLIGRLRDETQDSLIVAGSPAWFAKKIDDLAKYVTNPTFNYSRQRNSSYLQIRQRPDIAYQWGWVDSLPDDIVAEGSYPGRGMTDTYGVNSGINIAQLFSLSGGYSGAVGRTFYYDKEIRNESVAYPNASLRISNLHALPFLKKYTRNSSLMASFNQLYDKKFEIIDDSTSLLSESQTFNLNPLVSWQTTWLKGISSQLDITYSETNAKEYDVVDTLPSKRVNMGGSVNFSYRFSAPRGLGIPLLRGLKFSSNMSLNLGGSYSRTRNYSRDLVNPINDSSTLGVNVGLSYDFSSSITGGATVDYTQNRDYNADQDTRRVGMNFWVNINF